MTFRDLLDRARKRPTLREREAALYMQDMLTLTSLSQGTIPFRENERGVLRSLATSYQGTDPWIHAEATRLLETNR